VGRQELENGVMRQRLDDTSAVVGAEDLEDVGATGEPARDADGPRVDSVPELVKRQCVSFQRRESSSATRIASSVGAAKWVPCP
jgi:hypothetical protein